MADQSQTLAPDALYEQGSKTFTSSLGTSSIDFEKSFEDIAPGFGRLILEAEFGNAYHRPGLDLKTRELIIVATCATLGATGYDAAKMHIGAALRAGATRAEIVEALVQITFAAGLPTSIGALQAAREAFAKLDEKGS
ncbi:carboxymuconolactone decarboxylase family protein [Granulicella sibirica]|uniref:4-carboxymuconolactone decarboxylase n=1 Tax=Granulicella sibirica TaxID=2479048 RepID=A0A4Q0T0G5_9BACT|nr:carboxymuconolactone decarboxylase family protein [Granulicella sibirica]RXH57055.1 4-carboxymuconolactone decarboxylase [Granulicella sibirica]